MIGCGRDVVYLRHDERRRKNSQYHFCATLLLDSPSCLSCMQIIRLFPMNKVWLLIATPVGEDPTAIAKDHAATPPQHHKRHCHRAPGLRAGRSLVLFRPPSRNCMTFGNLAGRTSRGCEVLLYTIRVSEMSCLVGEQDKRREEIWIWTRKS